MRKLLVIVCTVLLGTTLCVYAQLYGNINTQQITTELPNRIGNTWNPTLSQYQLAGWRYITVIDNPATGYAATAWGVVDINGTNARQTVTSSYNIAEEAARLAAEALALKQSESVLDNATRIDKGVALVILDELNIIREWIASNKVEVAASISLADFKTRIGTLPAMPDRTVDQLKIAVSNKAVNLP